MQVFLFLMSVYIILIDFVQLAPVWAQTFSLIAKAHRIVLEDQPDNEGYVCNHGYVSDWITPIYDFYDKWIPSVRRSYRADLAMIPVQSTGSDARVGGDHASLTHPCALSEAQLISATRLEWSNHSHNRGCIGNLCYVALYWITPIYALPDQSMIHQQEWGAQALPVGTACSRSNS